MSNDPQSGSPRRGFLAVGAALFGGAAGAAFGYKERDPILDRWNKLRGAPRSLPAMAMPEFAKHAARIRDAQLAQTHEQVQQLKAKYEAPIFGKVRVWEVFEKLGMCIDPSDDSLLLTSQLTHVQQILEGMEHDGIEDKNMLLIALLHDLGKSMLLTTEAPEHIVGYTSPIGEFAPQAGLDQVIFQFGHDEMAYSRLKDHVPEEVAWTIRYHSTSLDQIRPYLSPRDTELHDKYMSKFHPYDLGLKSYSHLPKADMAKYRALIEDTFPQPILF